MFLDPEKPISKHRINLPHWQQEGTWVFVTWRQADSLPESAVRKILSHRAEWERDHPEPWDEQEMKERNRLFTMRFEELLDDCHGSCLLRDPELRAMVTTALHHFDGERYELVAYVVMPNHVHVLFRLLGEHRLEDVHHSWKLFSAREINRKAGRSGKLWQAECWDRLMRSQAHYDWTERYIERNPGNMPEESYTLWMKE
jgi:REP element-mobilizing transposase RayT